MPCYALLSHSNLLKINLKSVQKVVQTRVEINLFRYAECSRPSPKVVQTRAEINLFRYAECKPTFSNYEPSFGITYKHN